jgi:hypothetical protein
MTHQTNEIDEWQLKALQTRFKATYDLVLTVDQAKKVYKYEQDKNTYSEKNFFSVWEEWDYELSTFKEILNDEQFKNYETFLKENVQRYEQSLVELDNERINEIAYNEELINFYETQFLPDFFKDPFLLTFGWLSADKAKIEYLRTEYKNFLNDTKKAILTNHFRHHRTFKPKELKLSLLQHTLSYIYPDYTSFKHQMDKPTLTVAHYLKTKFQYLPDTLDELLTRKYNELKELNDANFKKHYGEIRGWHVVVGQLTPEEEQEHRAMTLLLLDNEKYGC